MKFKDCNGRAGVIFVFVFSMMMAAEGLAQKSVMDLFRSDRSLADRYYSNGELQDAIRLYERSDKPGTASVRLARGYFQLKEYRKCVDAYDNFRNEGKKMEFPDYLNYAEAQLTLKNYSAAQEYYRKILEVQPSHDWIIKKMWRISNIHYLYEDSVHFAVRSLSINTPDAEWGAVPFENGILFVSNRPSGSAVMKVDAATEQPFYKVYFAEHQQDTLLKGWTRYTDPAPYTKIPYGSGNAAGMVLYDGNKKIIYSGSYNRKSADGLRSLGLYFAQLQDGRWKETGEFDYNGATWSMTDPAITEDGKTLYFSSDRRGGKGGMDIYRSSLINSAWSEPVNLGEGINTPGDEVFPYVHQNTLYYSSNGLPGMGGLDIFKIDGHASAGADPVNLGYPMNSSYDDFSIRFNDAKGNHGLLSSNRKRGGLDDDVYEFDIDMQTYPFTITGIVKAMDHAWRDSSRVNIMPNARIRLVDNNRNVVVQETTSDATGTFTISIPYFSRYGIHVMDEEGTENIAAFDIPRQRNASTVHEIVMIRDIFQTVNKY